MEEAGCRPRAVKEWDEMEWDRVRDMRSEGRTWRRDGGERVKEEGHETREVSGEGCE